MKLELKVEHLLEPNIKPVLKKCQHILPSTPGAVEIVSDILQSYKQTFCELDKSPAFQLKTILCQKKLLQPSINI